MKQTYIDYATRTIADCCKPDALGIVLVTRINVPFPSRGQGHGSKILQQIIADADAEGITLELWPSPSGGLSGRALVAWYKRHGFQALPDGRLIRKPMVGSDA